MPSWKLPKLTRHGVHQAIAIAACVYALPIFIGGAHTLWLDLTNTGHVSALSYLLDFLMMLYLPLAFYGLFDAKFVSRLLISGFVITLLVLLIADRHTPDKATAVALVAILGVPMLLTGLFSRFCSRWI